MIVHNKPQLVFDGPFDQRDAEECRVRGYCGYAMAELASGEQYGLVFYDPVRLVQDLADEAEAGRGFIADPGLVILPEVTRDYMQAAIEQLEKEGFFKMMRPRQASDQTVQR